jgi:hypothetical protein
VPPRTKPRRAAVVARALAGADEEAVDFVAVAVVWEVGGVGERALAHGGVVQSPQNVVKRDAPVRTARRLERSGSATGRVIRPVMIRLIPCSRGGAGASRGPAVR